MAGIFITFEGTEGGGKSTQIELLAARLRSYGHIVRSLREPGGTPIGEEIRYLLKHSEANRAMTPEAELLLMNASRAQLVREIIRPALAAGEIVLCDRFYDSTTAYQGYGRGLDLGLVGSIIAAAVGDTKPDLTLVLALPLVVSEQRRINRQQRSLKSPPSAGDPSDALQVDVMLRDRMEEADRSFFERVEIGYRTICSSDPDRVRSLDANREKSEVELAIWSIIKGVWPWLVK